MSIVSIIQDFTESLITRSILLGNQLTPIKLINGTCLYFLKTIPHGVYYVFSLQWLHLFTLLPINNPRQLINPIFSENLSISIYNISKQIPSKVFFEFIEIPSFYKNKFFLGFFNSFFLSLPITIIHIITFQLLITQGQPAAFFSLLGFITGQTFFILCVTFGIRSILIPWFSLEPFNYFFGIILIFQIVPKMITDKIIVPKMISDKIKSTDLDSKNNKFFIINNVFIKKLFIINFILAWCEQTCIFQYFSNINLTGHVSILESFSTKTTLTTFFSNSVYICGIFIGNIVFSNLWLFLIIQLKFLIQTKIHITHVKITRIIKKLTIIVVLIFTFSSIPFYGFDYLLSGPLGFISQDNAFNYNDFYLLADPRRSRKLLVPNLAYKAFVDHLTNPLPIDPFHFDRGKYLVLIEGLIQDDREFELVTYEDLNLNEIYEINKHRRRSKRFGNKLDVRDLKRRLRKIKNIFKALPQYDITSWIFRPRKRIQQIQKSDEELKKIAFEAPNAKLKIYGTASMNKNDSRIKIKEYTEDDYFIVNQSKARPVNYEKDDSFILIDSNIYATINPLIKKSKKIISIAKYNDQFSIKNDEYTTENDENENTENENTENDENENTENENTENDNKNDNSMMTMSQKWHTLFKKFSNKQNSFIKKIFGSIKRIFGLIEKNELLQKELESRITFIYGEKPEFDVMPYFPGKHQPHRLETKSVERVLDEENEDDYMRDNINPDEEEDDIDEEKEREEKFKVMIRIFRDFNQFSLKSPYEPEDLIIIDTKMKEAQYAIDDKYFEIAKAEALITKKEEQLIRTRSRNFIYNKILSLDINFFLNRQPSSFFLSGEKELDLEKKRNLLYFYIDSLRRYNELPYSSFFKDFFYGTKSFTNKIYNQQFNGTLKNVRRLFSLSNISTKFLYKEIKSLNSILKYDQALYETSLFSPYHEEIPKFNYLISNEYLIFDENENTEDENEDENENAEDENEDTNEYLKNRHILNIEIISDFISKPVYAGWDKNFKKFIITNKFFPRYYAGYEINISQEWCTLFIKKFYNKQSSFIKRIFGSQKNFDNELTNPEKIYFSVWPVLRSIKREVPSFIKKPFTFLSKYIYSIMSTSLAEIEKPSFIQQAFLFLMDTTILDRFNLRAINMYNKKGGLPNNYTIVLNRLDSLYYHDVLKLYPEYDYEIEHEFFPNIVPKYGGFHWPGNLNFDFVEFLTLHFPDIAKSIKKKIMNDRRTLKFKLDEAEQLKKQPSRFQAGQTGM